MRAHQRMVAHYQAELYADMVSVWTALRDLGERDAAELHAQGLGFTSDLDVQASTEIRAALGLTRRAADIQIGIAFGLTAHPLVWDALHVGTIDLSRARILTEDTSHLDPILARQVVAQALPTAAEQTTGQLRARVARLCISIDPATAKTRFEEQLDERRVALHRTPTGTANLYGIDLDPAAACKAMRRINRLARAAKTRNDPRNIDQIRADIYLDLLCGHTPQHHNPKTPRSNTPDRAVIDIRTDLTTLLGLNDKPGEIPGWGPVIADITRQLATHQPNSQWQITITHPDHTTQVITTRRRPTQTQKRQVRAENPTCVFPGCRIPATQTDLDHTHPWNQTRQTNTNDLAPLCRHDHNNRHQHGWKYQKQAPGRYTWTSPLGHTYTTGPDPP